MELPIKILEKLKCSECSEYLSSVPVYLKNNSESICGRCYVPDDLKFARNNAYEDIASAILFPCRYEKDGCTKKLNTSEIKKHEEECSFLCYNCPVLPNGTCKWRGNRNSLLEHYFKQHEEFILESEYQPVFSNNNDTNLLMSASGFLFLVQIKCRTAFESFWVNIRLLNNERLKDLFECIIEMTNGVDKIIKSKTIQNHRNLTKLQPATALVFNIKNLLQDLGNKISMKVSIRMRETFCQVCKCILNSAPIFLEDGFVCEKCCTVNHKPCKNKERGCLFKDIDLNLNKHEKWMCKYGKSVCTKCRITLKETSLLEHDMEKHVNFRSDSNRMEFKNLSENQQYRAVLTTNDVLTCEREIKFYCIWKIGRDSLDFDVISNVSKIENRKFKCKLILCNPKIDVNMLEEEVNIVEQNDYYFDWDLTKKDGGFTKAIGNDDTYDLSFFIEDSF